MGKHYSTAFKLNYVKFNSYFIDSNQYIHPQKIPYLVIIPILN